MKKLMMAVAIVCAAVCAQAATANWTMSAANVYNGSGTATTADKYTGAAYIFDATAITQKALFDAFAADVAAFDVTKQDGYLATGAVASGSISTTNAANKFSAFEQGSGAHDFFFVLVDGDKMYASTTKAGVNASGTDDGVQISFGNQKVTTGAGIPNSSLAASDGWSQAGQWATASIPEPTSGLLLLLGMAGLALRRRRA